jgi:multiple sugar transport system substrate-binding protein
MISTGQVLPISGLKGFSTKGYFPAVINEGLSNHQYYSLPVAGANSIALIYNIAMFKAAHLTPPKTWAQLLSDAKALTTSDHYGIALTCEPAEDTTWQWEPFFWSNGGNFTFSNIASGPGRRAERVNQLITTVRPRTASSGARLTHRRSSSTASGHDGQRPWNFLTMNQSKLFTASSSSHLSRPKAGQHVVVPLGGERLDGLKAALTPRAFEYIQARRRLPWSFPLAKLPGLLPAVPAVANAYSRWQARVGVTSIRPCPRIRTLSLGVGQPKLAGGVDRDQAALSGSKSAGRVEHRAGQISTILKGQGGKRKTMPVVPGWRTRQLYRLPVLPGHRYWQPFADMRPFWRS